MSNHQWVKLMSVNVDILPSLEDEAFTAFTSEEALEKAEAKAVYGCEVCDEPLSDQTVNTECKGKPHDETPTA